MADYDVLIKLVVVGDCSVGKSSLLRTLKGEAWVENQQPTVGVDFVMQTMDIGGKVVKLQIWDTAGQEKFRALHNKFFRGAGAAAVVFDVTNLDSFRSVKGWAQEVRRHAGEPAMLLVGNKADLCEKRAVSEEEVWDVVASLGFADYTETSAKTDRNVNEAFRTTAAKGLAVWSERKLIADKQPGTSAAKAETITLASNSEPVRAPRRKWCVWRTSA
ncbi:Ras-related protein Rab-1A [Diplonema papillatum]|nr:Ras-related protein Rab-1A [Diplonema papillatum]